MYMEPAADHKDSATHFRLAPTGVTVQQQGEHAIVQESRKGSRAFRPALWIRLRPLTVC